MQPEISLYPFRFDPLFQYRLWGGRKLEAYATTPLPDGPIGEAWILSDREDHASVVADGAFKGTTLHELIDKFRHQMLGEKSHFGRFPLLLKFLDAREMLSVQVHPTDAQINLLPPGEQGKTEAWVVLQADHSSKIYAGLHPGTQPDDLRNLNSANVDKYLASFEPQVGDGVFIQAGTVHALGGGVVVFEVQQNSDVTFRLYDWDRVDPKTGQSRELHIEESIQCIDFGQGEMRPVNPTVESTSPACRELMFACTYFVTSRIMSRDAFAVGKLGEPRVVVCLHGHGHLESEGVNYLIRQGYVYLLPSAIGECLCKPETEMTVLEIALP
jgi:mannose-6-phosphate isomerase